MKIKFKNISLSLPFRLFLYSVSVAISMNANIYAEDQEELAKKLANPVANLISVPFQNNWDNGFGPADATKFVANIQPVIPFSLNDDWNLITRTILPIIHLNSPVEGGKNSSGTGDVLQSFFFSPKAPTNGWITGFGPAMLYSTASDPDLGGRKWAAGPTAVLLKQVNSWTYGFLGNHLWSYAGADDRQDINATFAQPFMAYITKTYTTFTINTEATYDWENHNWTIPINLQVSQLFKVYGHPISIGAGPRYYAESPDGGPEWGVRFVIQLLFPK